MIQPSAEWVLENRHIGRRVLVFDSVTSSNELAASLPDAEGIVVLVREQTAGRGQYGRSWHSPNGAGVWLSAVVSPPAELRRPVILTAWAAVAVAETVRTITKTTPTIKWPNDVMVNEKKVAGVLIELGQRAIIGIGLNVNQSISQFADAELPAAASLAILTGQSWECEQVARELIKNLDREYVGLLAGNSLDLQDRWRQLLGLIDHPVHIQLHSGRAEHGRCVQMDFESVAIAHADGQIQSYFPEELRNMSARSE